MLRKEERSIYFAFVDHSQVPWNVPSSRSVVKVLITHFRLAEQTASERLVCDLALLLQAGGATVAVFTTQAGPLADLLQKSGIPVAGHPWIGSFQPDLIHGHGNLETLTAMLGHPDVPAVFFSPGSAGWREHAPLHPRIHRYLTGSAAGKAWLVRERGVAPDRIAILPEWVDFSALGPPRRVPPKPRTALFADPAEGREERLARQACEELGIHFETISSLAGKSSLRPGELYPRYDLVFARGKSLLEALAAGCAAIPVSPGRIGELVTVRNFPAMATRGDGEGPEIKPDSIRLAELVTEIETWNWSELAPVAEKVREYHGSAAVLSQLTEIHRRALAHTKAQSGPDSTERTWTAGWLLELAQQQAYLDSGSLELRQRISALRLEQTQRDGQAQDLRAQLEIEKEKVRFARRLLQDGTVLQAGLKRRIEEGWREIETGRGRLRSLAGEPQPESLADLSS